MNRLIEKMMIVIMITELVNRGLVYECADCGGFHLKQGVTREQVDKALIEIALERSLPVERIAPKVPARRPELN